MSQTVNIPNFNTLNVLARTALTQDTPANSSSLSVLNTADFIVGSVLVGQPGQQTSEIASGTTIATATSVPLTANTKLSHNYNDPVLMLFGNQICVYRAVDQYGTGQQPDDVNFTKIATISIDATNVDTTYTDAGGAVSNWYKFTYTNGTSETALSDSAAAQAGQVHYVGLDDIRGASGFNNNRNVTDDMISKKRAAAEQEVNGALLPVYTFPLPQPTNPIIVEIVKQLAAGMLIHELYVNVSPQMAAEGESKAKAAREGGGSFTGLQELVDRAVVLTDANFNEETIDEGHAFGGWPDDTTNASSNMPDDNETNDLGYDQGHQFTITQDY